MAFSPWSSRHCGGNSDMLRNLKVVLESKTIQIYSLA
jgi:hypothetical protein